MAAAAQTLALLELVKKATVSRGSAAMNWCRPSSGRVTYRADPREATSIRAETLNSSRTICKKSLYDCTG